jgi:chemotaxis protein histidine kinase CheA
LLYGASPKELPEPGSSVVLLQTGTGSAALHVDGILGRQDVVVKPLSRLLRHQQGFSGATVLGDGRVMLILDPRAFSTVEA